ncbi:MAG: FxLYD domain-containing protein [Anaerolineae bacterium]
MNQRLWQHVGLTALIAGVVLLAASCSPSSPGEATPNVQAQPSPTMPQTASPRKPQLVVTEWIWRSEMSNDQRLVRAEGMVKNTSSAAVDRATIYFILRDARGRFLGSESAYVYQALAPGEQYPWDFTATVPDETETLTVFSIISDWADSPRERSADSPLQVTEWTERREGSDSYQVVKVQGLIENVSAHDIDRIQVHVVLRAADGRFLGVESCYAAETPLAAGATTLWGVTTQAPNGYARAEIGAITWD